jgi:DNA-binding MarR family transcriptional regulator
MNEPSSPAVDLLHTSACLCTALRRTARSLSAAYDRALAISGLTSSQFILLTRLADNGPESIKALAASLGIDRTTLSRALGPLLARGLISETAGDDRRVKWIALTSRGRTATARAQAAWHDIQEAIVAAFGADRATAMLTGLAALAGAADRPRIRSLSAPRTRPSPAARA